MKPIERDEFDRELDELLGTDPGDPRRVEMTWQLMLKHFRRNGRNLHAAFLERIGSGILNEDINDPVFVSCRDSFFAGAQTAVLLMSASAETGPTQDDIDRAELLFGELLAYQTEQHEQLVFDVPTAGSA